LKSANRTFVTQSTEAIWCYEVDPPIPTGWPAGQQIDHFFRHGWVAECNDAMARLYGFSSANDVRGQPVSPIPSRVGSEEERSFFAFIQNGYQFADREMSTVDAKGDTRILLTNVTGFVEDGLLIRAWGMHRDVTERKRMERKLLETQSWKASASWPAVSPMISIICSRAFWAMRAWPGWKCREDSPAQPCLEQIEQAAEQAADLCKQMLAYSGKGRFVVERLDLSAMVRSTADLIRPFDQQIRGPQLSLANGLPAISGDATQIRQIVMNLVINCLRRHHRTERSHQRQHWNLARRSCLSLRDLPRAELARGRIRISRGQRQRLRDEPRDGEENL